MLLRISTFDVIREITSIGLDPRFPAGVFDVTAPEGTKTRWVGKGEPPAEYAVSPAPPSRRVTRSSKRLDAATNQLVDEPLATGSSSGGVAWAGARLWSTSDQHREVKIGPAQSFYHSVASIDPATRAITQFDLGADAFGTPIPFGDSLWVPTTAINARDPYKSDFALVEMSSRTGEVRRRVALGGWPNAPVTDGERLYLLVGDDSQQSHLVAVDAASGTVATAKIGSPGAELAGMAYAGGHLWLASITDGAVLKIDPTTLAVTTSITIGRVSRERRRGPRLGLGVQRGRRHHRPPRRRVVGRAFERGSSMSPSPNALSPRRTVSSLESAMTAPVDHWFASDA